MAFQLFPLRFNSTNEYECDSCRTFVSISISSGVFKVLICDSIQDIQGYISHFKASERTLSASLPRWRTTGRAPPLWLGVCSHCIEWWYLFQKNFKEATKKAYPNLEWHLQRPHTFQWATLLVLVGKQPASIRGFANCMWCLCLFVLRCKQCGTWAWTAST